MKDNKNKKIGELKLIELFPQLKDSDIYKIVSSITDLKKEANNSFIPFVNELKNSYIQMSLNYSKAIKSINESFTTVVKNAFEGFINIDFTEMTPSKMLFRCGWVSTKFLIEETEIKDLKLSKFKDTLMIDKLISNIFSKSNYTILEIMVNRWKSNRFYKPIINDLAYTVSLIKVNNMKIAKIIVPYLLIQIEYINDKCLKEVIKLYNKKYNKKISFNKWNWLELYENDFDKLAAPLIIQKILFANLDNEKGSKGRDDVFAKYNNEKYFKQFSRHKIIHGKYRQYATIKNVLKLYFILDLYYDISNEIIKGEISI